MSIIKRVSDVRTCLVDISEDDDLSTEVDLGGYALMGLIIPTIDSANLTFEVSDATGGTFSTLKDKGGTAVTVTAGTGGFAVSADDLAPLAAYRYVKVATSATQTADRTFKFILKG